MADIEVDVLVIGWGKGGKTLAGALGRQGRTVALVEQSNQMYGGSCINIACVPTKDLVHSAAERRAGDDRQAWFTDAVAGRDDLIAKLRARNHAMLAEVDTVTLIDGNLIALAMRAGVTASTLRDGIWTHPSSTEALNEVLAELRPLRH